MIALPLEAGLYVREKDVPRLPPQRRRVFRTKPELAAEQLRDLAARTEGDFAERWAVVDGGYANRPFLDAARKAGFVVVARLRKDAAWRRCPARARRGGEGRPGSTARTGSAWRGARRSRAAGSRRSASSTGNA